MNGKLLKTIDNFMHIGLFLRDKFDKNTTFMHKAITVLICCNITIFVINALVLHDIVI